MITFNHFIIDALYILNAVLKITAFHHDVHKVQIEKVFKALSTLLQPKRPKFH